MKTFEDILELSKQYLEAHAKQTTRFKAWQEVLPTIKKTLDTICNLLIANNGYFKNNLYVIQQLAEGDVYIKSGSMLVPISNNGSENGFQIHFSQLSNGKALVYAFGHSITTTPTQINIEIIDDPTVLTEQKIIELVFQGLNAVLRTSYMFIGD